MKNDTWDNDRWESLPSPEPREQRAHEDSSPDTRVFGAEIVRERDHIVGMPANISLFAREVIDLPPLEPTPASTPPSPADPVAGGVAFDDELETSDVEVFRRSALLRLHGGAFPEVRRPVTTAPPGAAQTIAAPERTRGAATVILAALAIASGALFALPPGQRALRVFAAVIERIFFNAR